MKFRVLLVSSHMFGTLDPENINKEDISKYISYMIKKDHDNAPNEYPKEINQDNISVVPVMQTSQSLDYIFQQVSSTNSINNVLIQRINELIRTQLDSIIMRIDNKVDLEIAVLMFVIPASLKVNAQEISKSVLDNLEDVANSKPKAKIEEISFGYVEEGDFEEPEEIVYN